MTRMKKLFAGFMKEEEGLGTIEMLLILAVIVVIAIAFRKWIMKWVTSLFSQADKGITEQSNLNDSLISPSTTP